MEPAWDAIQSLIADLRREVVTRTNGGLTITSRNRLLAAMGKPNYDESFEPPRPLKTSGMLRRLRLSELCLERVFPIWEQHVGSHDPIKMIETSHAYLDDKVSWDQAWEVKNSFEGGLQHVYQLPKEGFPAALVGFAARGTLSIPLYDDWDRDDTPDEELDSGWDPYVCAAAAHARDMPWGDRFDSERFRAFWLWMLDDGLARAWNASRPWW